MHGRCATLVSGQFSSSVILKWMVWSYAQSQYLCTKSSVEQACVRNTIPVLFRNIMLILRLCIAANLGLYTVFGAVYKYFRWIVAASFAFSGYRNQYNHSLEISNKSFACNLRGAGWGRGIFMFVPHKERKSYLQGSRPRPLDRLSDALQTELLLC